MHPQRKNYIETALTPTPNLQPTAIYNLDTKQAEVTLNYFLQRFFSSHISGLDWECVGTGTEHVEGGWGR